MAKKPAAKKRPAPVKARAKKAEHKPAGSRWPWWDRLFRGASLIVLLATSAYWSALSALTHAKNADQLINLYLFESLDTFHKAVFPLSHTMLFKWPIFLLIKFSGITPTNVLIATVCTTLITVGVFAFMLQRIEIRPIVLGTIYLALASVLMVVPAQPYAGAILPVNMAMLTTRNFEYLLFIASIWLLITNPKLKSWRIWSSALLLTIIVASDKLFMSLSIGGALICLVSFAVFRRREQTVLAAKWLLTSVLGALGGNLLLWAIAKTHTTTFSSSSSIAGPYGHITTIKQAGSGGVHAVLGTLTNFGANPAADTHVVRAIPHQMAQGLLSLGIVAYLVNLAIVGFALFCVYRVLRLGFTKKQTKSHQTNHLNLAIMLVAASLTAVAVFVGSNHYYPVDSRYLSITVFAAFIAASVYLSTWVRVDRRKFIIVGIVLTLSVVCGGFRAWQLYTQQTNAMSETTQRNDKVVKALQEHHVDYLVGDYWRIVPIKGHSSNTINVLPLDSCDHAREVLSSKNWQVNLDQHSFAYLLSFDADNINYKSCSLQEVLDQFARPNSSTVIAGTPDQPKEMLLFYDAGAHHSAPAAVLPKPSTVTPIGLDLLPNKTCDGQTIMNIVAHQDDDLLFASPDLVHDIHAKNCVRTVYVTAGDAGNKEFYWISREKASEAAYTKMAGIDPSVIWVQRVVKLADNQFITIANPRGNPKISLIFLHLPDGNTKGQGFARTNDESLKKLQMGRIPMIKSVDGFSDYTNVELTLALVNLMKAYEPAEIRTQAQDMSEFPPDHSDHIATGHYATTAFHEYSSEPNSQHTVIKFYRGYPIAARPENVFGQDLEDKRAAFLAYADLDGNVCVAQKTPCRLAMVYTKYLGRQYQATQ